MAKKLLIKLIRFYRRKISPSTKPSCRFMPTCSEYALEAVETHGAAKGSYFAIKRILKCHPFHKGGIDNVPPKNNKNQNAIKLKGQKL